MTAEVRQSLVSNTRNTTKTKEASDCAKPLGHPITEGPVLDHSKVDLDSVSVLKRAGGISHFHQTWGGGLPEIVDMASQQLLTSLQARSFRVGVWGVTVLLKPR